MMTYEETMAYGAAQYADVLQLLRQSGLPAKFVQTGGMNAAISVTLEAGFYLLITDEEDTLAWERSEHRGWYAGLYPPEDGAEPHRWETTEASSATALMSLVDLVLGSASARPKG